MTFLIAGRCAIALGIAMPFAATAQSGGRDAELAQARTYTAAHDTANAFVHLRAAASSGFEPRLIANDPAYASLRSTATYAAILQAAENVRFPCNSQHGFDFWEGVFTVTPWDEPKAVSIGTVTNTRTEHGCVFMERWDGGPDSQGMSMVFYDTNRQRWRMIWNSDRNSSNDFEGEYRDGGMHFTGWQLNAAGSRVLVSNVLIDASPDLIHHQLFTSADSGKTWTIRSDTRWTRQ